MRYTASEREPRRRADDIWANEVTGLREPFFPFFFCWAYVFFCLFTGIFSAEITKNIPTGKIKAWIYLSPDDTLGFTIKYIAQRMTEWKETSRRNAVKSCQQLTGNKYSLFWTIAPFTLHGYSMFSYHCVAICSNLTKNNSHNQKPLASYS